jgi:hypothetical protein
MDGYLRGAFNNGRKIWKGDIEIRADCEPDGARELWEGKKVCISRKEVGCLVHRP